eukprot:NODE_67_length_25542_cov_1.476831.p3 type:complete len:588 gc:universal NODE_67_length_25542_cov_1.476831:5560-3797(-)
MPEAKSPTKSELIRPLHKSGTAGNKVRVMTNYVKFKNTPSKDIFMYNLMLETIDEKGNKVPMKKRERNEHVEAFLIHMKELDKQVFASGNLILSFDGDLEDVYPVKKGTRFNKETNEREDRIVQMELKKTVKRNLQKIKEYTQAGSKMTPSEVQEVLQACDILIKCDPTFKRLVYGVGMFNPNTKFTIRNSCLEMYKGIQCHTKAVASGLLLNVDAKYHTSFRELNLHEAIKASGYNNYKKLTMEFKNVQVKIDSKTTKRKDGRIVSFSEKNAKEFIIKMEGKPDISVNEYFASKGVNLKYPTDYLVCVNKTKNTYYPPELLKIAPNQSFEKPVPDISEIRRETCLNPEDRKRYILSQLRDNLLKASAASGFEVDSELLSIPARFLDAPAPLFSEVPARLNQNNNAIETRNQKFSNACNIESYAVVTFCNNTRPRTIEDHLLRNLETVARNHTVGLPRQRPKIIECPVDPRRPYIDFEEDVERAMANAVEEAKATHGKKPDIIFCITPSQTCGVYNHVKRLTETTDFSGNDLILTQFCDAAKFRENRGRVTVNAQYCSNLLLKINEKLSFVIIFNLEQKWKMFCLEI